jgi:MFS family permease
MNYDDMQAFVGNLIQRKPRRALSPEFKHALAREILKTERLRIIALIITATVLAAGLTTADVVAPAILDRIWRGHFPILYVLVGYVGFVLFEASVLALVSRQLKRDLDVPRARRYLVPALGFVAPLLYFVFIIQPCASTSGFRLSPVSWRRPSCSDSRCFIPPRGQPSAIRCWQWRF